MVAEFLSYGGERHRATWQCHKVDHAGIRGGFCSVDKKIQALLSVN